MTLINVIEEACAYAMYKNSERLKEQLEGLTNWWITFGFLSHARGFIEIKQRTNNPRLASFLFIKHNCAA